MPNLPALQAALAAYDSSTRLYAFRLVRTISVCMLSIPILTACFKSGASTNDIPVSLHGVNYSDQEFSYSLEDPNDKSNTGGGETIDRYGAGGTICCYSLPKKWRPGLKVKLDITHWLTLKPDKTLKEVHQSRVVDIPNYMKPSEIWVLRESDGKPTIVVSDFQPDHPHWPGTIKGWPIASSAYKHERWALMKKLAVSEVRDDEFLLQKLIEKPDERSLESWNTDMQYRPLELVGFLNSKDLRYRQKLRKEDETRLIESKKKLEELIGEEP